MRRLIVGFSGATGAIYGIRLLNVLRSVNDIETHLIISNAAKRTIQLETDHTLDEVETLADKLYNFNDVAAAISSGRTFTNAPRFARPTAVRAADTITASFILSTPY